MRKTIILIFGIALLQFALISCGGGPKEGKKGKELEGTITISGAFALYPITVKWAEEFQKIYPEVRIDISAGGAGKGMADALSGMAELGMFSREVTEIEIEKGAWYIAVARDAVLPTINEKNPAGIAIHEQGMSRQEFMELFLEDGPHRWKDYFGGDGEEMIDVYTRSDACGAAEMWGKFLGANQESLKGVGVYGDPGMADAIRSDKQGLGFNNVVYAYDMNTRMLYPGLDILPIDVNGNGKIDTEEDFYGILDSVMTAIADGRYPSPPARDLYFVAKGQPEDKAVKAFLSWILSEGQQYLPQAGYVSLSDAQIETEKNKLE